MLDTVAVCGSLMGTNHTVGANGVHLSSLVVGGSPSIIFSHVCVSLLVLSLMRVLAKPRRERALVVGSCTDASMTYGKKGTTYVLRAIQEGTIASLWHREYLYTL